MGSPIVVGKTGASIFLLICTILMTLWAVGVLVVLMVKLNFIDFHLDSRQLDMLQQIMFQVWLFSYMFSFVSICTIDVISKPQLNLKNLFKKSKARQFLFIALITFLILAVSIYFFPVKSVRYDISDNKWYLISKGFPKIIQVFEDDLARSYVWNGLLYASIFSVGINNVSIYHLLNVRERIDNRLSNKSI